MPRPEKVQAVEEIREQLDEARATFVTEYRGLTVAEQQQLRRDVRQAQGEYRVLKMSLARRAVEDMEVEGLTELLAGPTALAFAGNDPVPVAKALKEFASKNDNLIIKGGLLAGALLPPEQISRLADIESREVLLGRIAGGFKSPMSKLAGMLGAKMRDAASMFSQLLEKREAEEPAPAAPEAEAEAAPADEAEEVTEAEETPEAKVEETAEAEAEESPEAEVGETPEVEAEEAPADEAEEVTEAAEAPEAEAAEAPEAEAEKTPAAVADDAPADEPEEKPRKKAAPQTEVVETPEAAEPEGAPEAEVEKTPEAEAEESPAAEPEAAEAGTEEKPKKKKAAPKAEAKESAAPAEHADPEGQEEPAADETAEEE